MKIHHNGKEFTFHRLDNGLIRTFDYSCGWALTYKKEGDEWIPHGMVAMGSSYKGLLPKLNHAMGKCMQPTFSVEGGEPMI